MRWFSDALYWSQRKVKPFVTWNRPKRRRLKMISKQQRIVDAASISELREKLGIKVAQAAPEENDVEDMTSNVQ